MGTENKYNEIMNLPHHVSKKHKPMSMKDRAAQFAPFAALTGLDSQIEKTGKETEVFYDTEDLVVIDDL